MGYTISQLELIYLIIWSSFSIASLLLIIKEREHYEFLHKTYLTFLMEPWKGVTFTVAMIMLILAAPYSGDHTWDTQDSILCSILTYIFSPWAIAIFYQHFKFKTISRRKCFVAFCAFWSPCWAYDAYILFRDHDYPATWWTNLIISGGICFSAGLFWNLAWTSRERAYFAFYKPSWPNVPTTPLLKVIPYMFILAIPIISAVIWFLWTHCSLPLPFC